MIINLIDFAVKNGGINMKYSINRNVLEIIGTFDGNDIRKFRKFLKSSYLNPYPKAAGLFCELLKFYPEFNDSRLNRIDIFRRIENGKAYNDSTARDLISKLKFLLEKYLGYVSFENNRFEYLAGIRKELNRRKLYAQIEKNITEAEKIIPDYNRADHDYFYKKIKVETEKFNHNVINKKLDKKQSLNESIVSLNNSSKNQLSLFILESIKQNDTILKITKRQEKIKTKNLIPELLQPMNLKKLIVTLQKNNKELSHIFQIYYDLYRLFSGRDDENNFFIFKQNILENSHKINSDELHFLFGRLIDYCVNKCNEGHTEYYKELFNAYGVLLENRYYTNSSNKFISQDLFRNIFQTALRLNNVKWAEDFTNRYRRELHPGNRESMYYYCYSCLKFENKEFASSLEYLQKIKHDYFALKIDIKLLQLKIYYELGIYEQLYNQIDSFKHFIAKHELIQPSRKNRIREFVLYFEKLLKAGLNNDMESIGYIAEQLQKKNDSYFFRWLLVKAEELRSKFSAKKNHGS